MLRSERHGRNITEKISFISIAQTRGNSAKKTSRPRIKLEGKLNSFL